MGHSVLVNGQRGADGCDRPGSPDPALTVLSPLWDWTDTDIGGYIEIHQLRLPQQYAAGYPDSLECWNCTAEVDRKRFEYLRANHREEWEHLQRGLRVVHGAVSEELQRGAKALDLALMD